MLESFTNLSFAFRTLLYGCKDPKYFTQSTSIFLIPSLVHWRVNAKSMVIRTREPWSFPLSVFSLIGKKPFISVLRQFTHNLHLLRLLQIISSNIRGACPVHLNYLSDSVSIFVRRRTASFITWSIYVIFRIQNFKNFGQIYVTFLEEQEICLEVDSYTG